MNSKGTEHMAKKIVKSVKVILIEKKSNPITMDKDDSSGGTELEIAAVETETNMKNLKKD